jgi:hypothetical protein
MRSPVRAIALPDGQNVSFAAKALRKLRRVKTHARKFQGNRAFHESVNALGESYFAHPAPSNESQ